MSASSPVSILTEPRQGSSQPDPAAPSGHESCELAGRAQWSGGGMGGFQGQQRPPGGSASWRPLPQIPACDCVSGEGQQHSAPKFSTFHAQFLPSSPRV